MFSLDAHLLEIPRKKILLLHTNGLESQDWPARLRDRLQGNQV